MLKETFAQGDLDQVILYLLPFPVFYGNHVILSTHWLLLGIFTQKTED